MALEKKLIGQTELIDFPELNLERVAARIDTGAKTSAIWASNMEIKDGILRFTLFDEASEYYTGDVLKTPVHHIRTIISSIGTKEDRYGVKLLILISGRRIRASFTLANRSLQTYPVLIGRNVLSGKFLVDVEHGHQSPTIKQSPKQVERDLII
jgi:hypothetical protein